MADRLPELLVHARNRLVVKAEIMRKAVGRLLLIEPLHNAGLGSEEYFNSLWLRNPLITYS
ncbi:MAG: hypothetical protein Q8R13_03670 [bacterium]|nr:hypothetical protein [bacterium]